MRKTYSETMTSNTPASKRLRLGEKQDQDQRRHRITLVTIVENCPFEVISNIKSFLLGLRPVSISTTITSSSNSSNSNSNTGGDSYGYNRDSRCSSNYGKDMVMEYCCVRDLWELASQFEET